MYNLERTECCTTSLLRELQCAVHRETERETDTGGVEGGEEDKSCKTTYPGPAPLFNMHSRGVTEKLKTEKITTCSCNSLEKQKKKVIDGCLFNPAGKERTVLFLLGGVQIHVQILFPSFVSVTVISRRPTDRSTA